MPPADANKPAPPSSWVTTVLPHVAAGQTKTLLDVACGSGRHLALAYERGYTAVGLDRDISYATDWLTSQRQLNAPPVSLIQVDLETSHPWPLAHRTFDVVVVTNYLYRPRLSDVISHVAADGMLIYETFAIGQQRFGRPSNPDFLLQPGELLRVVHPNLTPFFYEHRQLDQPDRIVQRSVAVGPSHPWHETPPLIPVGSS